MTSVTGLLDLRRTVPQKYIPVMVTAGLFIAMFVAGGIRYEGFATGQIILNVFIDNAFLLVVAVGMTFVILTGGIDLSVGSVVGLSTMISASLLKDGWPAFGVMALVLVIGAVLGLGMGAIIHYFEIQPFIVTLAGMFLARGLCYTISTDSIPIENSTFTAIAQTRVDLGGDMWVSPSVLIALVVVLAAAYVLHYTRLGRNVYATGGSEQSALLMGLPVARTKIAVYTVSGFCSALGGLLFAFYSLSGYGLSAVGMELDAIAAVVIGGTLLTGGSGYLLGTVLGVLVLGLIQTIISFEGTLSSWWTKIFIGLLLFAFILLQRLITARRR
ncbi:sugar ABC transporter permease YjfF [Microbispora triticiradicis]|uniref:Sugar ABC transporter permease YjfF n=3 Tax=Microbispora TaxID=2005 RepID=A0ABY3LN22_9ACTN|nr:MULTISPECIES: galactofuranose ABC transporter, permease protein YjfF [Microbispora]RGA06232.1 sugar ABC transporter permease YjfF [Microbispora triticiradicis]TLP54634.1 sugar ABC transporter permease YjfF [Microbispora fusca]TYB43169.1 sugar ABC transporter permease YjfF [Microbispora tritici]GLW20851.1 sugar ABC transporter permease [Microbispora amethystogenes]